jgi:hypothetical protein
MKKYWLVGNNLQEQKQINLTFDSNCQAEKMKTYYSLLGYECKLSYVPVSTIETLEKMCSLEQRLH